MSSSRQAFDAAFKQINQPGSPFEVGRKIYDGREYPAFVNAPKTLTEMLDAGRRHADLEYILYEGDRWTFNDFFEKTDRLANQLIDQFGASKGTRVAIVMRNYPEWLVSFTAIVSVGAVAVPLNSWGLAQEIHQNLKDAEVDIVICDDKRLMLLELDELNVQVIVARAESEDLPAGCQHFNDVLAGAKSTQKPSVDLDPEDVAMIMFTSGTTGRAKGAVFSNRNCCQGITNFEACGAAYYMVNIEQFTRHAKQGYRTKVLLAFPLFHVSGLFSQFVGSLRNGSGVVMMYKWDPEQAIKFIEQERVTLFSGTPTMLIDLLKHPDFAGADTRSLGNVGAGGQAMPESVARLMFDSLENLIPGTGWGLTETSAAGSQILGSVYADNPGSAGLVSPIVELRFCDESGREVEKGTQGEIWVYGPTIIRGYCNAPEANKTEFIDGWFKTGDIGYLDENGFLYICDRAKDMVIRGGENIYPLEIEQCIHHIPGVKSVSAFGIPSERFGEELAAVIIPERGAQLTQEQVQQYCKERLAGFKVPSAVKFSQEDFPVNASGKVLKKAVKAKFFG